MVARLVKFCLVVCLALLGAALLGSGFSGGGGWTTNDDPDDIPDVFSFGTLLVSSSAFSGDDSGLCVGEANEPAFSNAANDLHDAGKVVNAFAFLTAVNYARTDCGLEDMNPATWGYIQAGWFLTNLANSSYDGPVNYYYADVECLDGCQYVCDADDAEWLCDHEDDMDVITTFLAVLKKYSPSVGVGIYSNLNGFDNVLQGATASEVGTAAFWLASHGATADVLADQVRVVMESGFWVTDWQYDDGCSVNPLTALHRVLGSWFRGRPVFSFDAWTNDYPSQCIQEE